MSARTFSPKVRETLDIIVAGINETIPDATVYLFGSYARGEATADSDFDILVTTPDKSKRQIEWGFESRRRLLKLLPVPMDLFVQYTDEFAKRSLCTVTLEHLVKTQGVVLHGA